MSGQQICSRSLRINRLRLLLSNSDGRLPHTGVSLSRNLQPSCEERRHWVHTSAPRLSPEKDDVTKLYKKRFAGEKIDRETIQEAIEADKSLLATQKSANIEKGVAEESSVTPSEQVIVAEVASTAETDAVEVKVTDSVQTSIKEPAVEPPPLEVIENVPVEPILQPVEEISKPVDTKSVDKKVEEPILEKTVDEEKIISSQAISSKDDSMTDKKAESVNALETEAVEITDAVPAQKESVSVLAAEAPSAIEDTLLSEAVVEGAASEAVEEGTATIADVGLSTTVTDQEGAFSKAEEVVAIKDDATVTATIVEVSDSELAKGDAIAKQEEKPASAVSLEENHIIKSEKEIEPLPIEAVATKVSEERVADLSTQHVEEVSIEKAVEVEATTKGLEEKSPTETYKESISADTEASTIEVAVETVEAQTVNVSSGATEEAASANKHNADVSSPTAAVENNIESVEEAGLDKTVDGELATKAVEVEAITETTEEALTARVIEEVSPGVGVEETTVSDTKTIPEESAAYEAKEEVLVAKDTEKGTAAIVVDAETVTVEASVENKVETFPNSVPAEETVKTEAIEELSKTKVQEEAERIQVVQGETAANLTEEAPSANTASVETVATEPDMKFEQSLAAKNSEEVVVKVDADISSSSKSAEVIIDSENDVKLKSPEEPTAGTNKLESVAATVAEEVIPAEAKVDEGAESKEASATQLPEKTADEISDAKIIKQESVEATKEVSTVSKEIEAVGTKSTEEAIASTPIEETLVKSVVEETEVSQVSKDPVVSEAVEELSPAVTDTLAGSQEVEELIVTQPKDQVATLISPELTEKVEASSAVEENIGDAIDKVGKESEVLKIEEEAVVIGTVEESQKVEAFEESTEQVTSTKSDVERIATGMTLGSEETLPAESIKDIKAGDAIATSEASLNILADKIAKVEETVIITEEVKVADKSAQPEAPEKTDECSTDVIVESVSSKTTEEASVSTEDKSTESVVTKSVDKIPTEVVKNIDEMASLKTVDDGVIVKSSEVIEEGAVVSDLQEKVAVEIINDSSHVKVSETVKGGQSVEEIITDSTEKIIATEAPEESVTKVNENITTPVSGDTTKDAPMSLLEKLKMFMFGPKSSKHETEIGEKSQENVDQKVEGAANETTSTKSIEEVSVIFKEMAPEETASKTGAEVSEAAVILEAKPVEEPSASKIIEEEIPLKTFAEEATIQSVEESLVNGTVDKSTEEPAIINAAKEDSTSKAPEEAVAEISPAKSSEDTTSAFAAEDPVIVKVSDDAKISMRLENAVEVETCSKQVEDGASLNVNEEVAASKGAEDAVAALAAKVVPPAAEAEVSNADINAEATEAKPVEEPSTIKIIEVGTPVKALEEEAAIMRAEETVISTAIDASAPVTPSEAVETTTALREDSSARETEVLVEVPPSKVPEETTSAQTSEEPITADRALKDAEITRAVIANSVEGPASSTKEDTITKVSEETEVSNAIDETHSLKPSGETSSSEESSPTGGVVEEQEITKPAEEMVSTVEEAVKAEEVAAAAAAALLAAKAVEDFKKDENRKEREKFMNRLQKILYIVKWAIKLGIIKVTLDFTIEKGIWGDSKSGEKAYDDLKHFLKDLSIDSFTEETNSHLKDINASEQWNKLVKTIIKNANDFEIEKVYKSLKNATDSVSK